MTQHLVDAIQTPALWTPEMSGEEWEAELDAMLLRSYNASRFVEGKISADDFAEILFDTNYKEPQQVFDNWLNGFMLI